MWHRIIRNMDARRFVFVDEFGANIRLTRLFGWAPRGERSRGTQLRNYDTNLTVCASLTLDGITSAMILDGAMNGPAFDQYVERVLLPTLQPKQIVVMDNLSSHKQAPIRAMIEAVGCRVVFLPSYSPDFNPIEQAISKIKQRLRRVGAKTTEALEAAIGEAIDLVSPKDADGFFTCAGYKVQ